MRAQRILQLDSPLVTRAPRVPVLWASALLSVSLSVGVARGEGLPRPLTTADASAGRPIYLRECSACHGERGDGNGPAVPFLEVRPRNFLKASYKFKSTPSGEAPRTDDVLGVIERGVPGSGMPSFKFLPPEERRSLAAFVLNLGELLEESEPDAVPVSIQPPTSPETIARGKVMYAEQQCGSCHGASGKGDGPSGKSMKDSDGYPIKVRDLTTGNFRGGSRSVDLYYRFSFGLDGTPMPSYGDIVAETDRWALVDFINSMKSTAPPLPAPKDPMKAGRALAAAQGCRGCHVLDNGKGADVGPDLRISGQKLGATWVRRFLKAPRAVGKIYPVRPHRMPDLALSDQEVEILVNYVSKMGKRKNPELTLPDVAKFPPAQVAAGQVLFMVRCTECHALGKVVETPVVKQQGPDLIHVADRVDFDWAKAWITDPKKIDPKTKMTVPGLSPSEIDQVRMFVWKSSIEESGRTASR